MQRTLAIVAAVLVSGVLAYYVARGQPSLDTAATPVEKLLAAGRPADARRELESLRSSLDAPTADYLDGLILLVEGNDAGAAVALEKARAARPRDWRIVDAAAMAAANSGRFAAARSMREAYVAAAPDDERGLVALAKCRLDARCGPIDPADALASLDRVANLKSRVAPPEDTTSVPDALIRQLRTKAYILSGRETDAMLEARKATQVNPADPESWFLLGEATRRLKQGPASLDAYRRASQLVPTERRYAEQLCLALLQFDGDGAEILGIAEALASSSPGDASLKLLRARALVRMQNPKDPATDHYVDEAASVYRDLVKRDDTPTQVRQDARRNLAVLLYDWKQGGRPGEYLDEAWELLREWRRLGGQLDDSIRPTWEDLEQRYARKDAGGR
jgi:Flp pilus assembly protein TadD